MTLLHRSLADTQACFVQGVFEHLQSKDGKVPEPVGLELIVDGTVPEGDPLLYFPIRHLLLDTWMALLAFNEALLQCQHLSVANPASGVRGLVADLLASVVCCLQHFDHQRRADCLACRMLCWVRVTVPLNGHYR